ncbi:hypothetical protein EB001_19710 [bacterium]|nr:hypothetical protein [bacterium]
MDFDELKRKHSFSSFDVGNTQYKNRIAESLKETETGRLMLECSTGGSRCGSIYCDECRNRKQKSLYYRYKKHYKEKLGNEFVARKKLRWVSVLHNVVSINVSTQSEEQETLINVDKSVEEMKGIISLMRKKYADRGLWMRGGIHLEVVDYKAFRTASELGNATIKEKTLTSFIRKMSNTDSDFVFLVHFHALLDMGDMNDGAIELMFAERWNSALRQVDISSLWDEVNAIQYNSKGQALRDSNGMFIRKKEKQKIEHGLQAMANYCFSYSNDKLQYARNWSHGKHTTEVEDELLSGNIKRVATQVGIRQHSKRMSRGHIRLLVLASNLINRSSHKGLEVRIDDREND